MKKSLLLIATLSLLLVLTTSVVGATGPAVQIKDGGCALIDAQGFLFFDPDAAHAVYTDSATGNSMIVCTSWLPEGRPLPDKAVKWTVDNWGGFCGTFFGITTKFHNVVTPSGRVILTCQANPSSY